MKSLINHLLAWIAVLTAVAGLLLLVLFLLPVVPSLSINGPSWVPMSPAWLVNLLLILGFGLQHSIMARPGFKQRVSRWLPKDLERSLYVFSSGLLLGILPFLWQPMPDVIWWVKHPIGQMAIYGLFSAGCLVAIAAVIAIDGLELLGFRQAGVAPQKPITFQRSWLHNRVRHPIYSGLLLMFWLTPTMTVGHLLFAIQMTVYIRIGIFFEERHLVRSFGDNYRNYRREVPMLIPFSQRVRD